MDSLANLKRAAKGEMARLEARLGQTVPQDWVALGPDAEGGSEKYTWVPENIEKINRDLRGSRPAQLHDFNRYVLLHYISCFSLEQSRYRLPHSIKALYVGQIERILRQIESFEDGFFDIANDGFLKDLAILTHRLIPVGAEFAEGGAGIPRRLIIAGGPKQMLAALWLLLFRCHGFAPFFALHAHTLSLEDFNVGGWSRTYHRLAELLDLNPQMKGWLSASWFLDPALETISPHLVHLREVPTENGAALLFVNKDREGRSGALSRSATRRRLFAQGTYIPAIYMRIWPRKALIAWSRGHRKEPKPLIGHQET